MKLFRVAFHNYDKIYELFAERVAQAEIYGLIEISGLRFGEQSLLVVDPAEEKLRAEFEAVESFMIPLQAVIRIDQVEKTGVAKILPADESNIRPFPVVPRKKSE
ncbi:MAG: DUF1820 family protein [gamma proteobacterium symbiont of Bathyaustriella thionipta]|nr:DUF1820 family protein [gamma proteobacterium symbiont of Bathyaustriella thionipta]